MIVLFIKLDDVGVCKILYVTFPADRIVAVGVCEKGGEVHRVNQHGRWQVLVHVHLG